MPLHCASQKNLPEKRLPEKPSQPKIENFQTVLQEVKPLNLHSASSSISTLRSKHHELFVGVRAPGLDNTQWRKLSRGKIAVDAKLDLHGYTVQEAFDHLNSFIHRAKILHWRCVEIVTGMGSGERGGMIRRELPLWLQRKDIRPHILAVVHPHKGNQGAVRVLLRRKRS
ncbi:DNA mismatch repair protein MutS [Aristophania vespae]|uniref:DNA mismatch repair protein MutS n=2 Tax=Aristophania vespae TaxID=2697033 RepID=A0A6P1NHL5_9PROT|nr:DNA mismatch repair protein MutS [Aristophania vespae]